MLTRQQRLPSSTQALRAKTPTWKRKGPSGRSTKTSGDKQGAQLSFHPAAKHSHAVSKLQQCFGSLHASDS